MLMSLNGFPVAQLVPYVVNTTSHTQGSTTLSVLKQKLWGHPQSGNRTKSVGCMYTYMHACIFLDCSRGTLPRALSSHFEAVSSDKHTGDEMKQSRWFCLVFVFLYEMNGAAVDDDDDDDVPVHG